MDTYLGVDIGTTITKAALFDGSGTAVAVTERPTRLERAAPNRVEQEADDVLHSVGAVVTDVLSSTDAPAPALLAITGQGDGCWLVDEHGHAVRRAISWMDGRAGAILARWERDGTAEGVFRATGNALFPGSMACLLRWLDEHEPESLDRAATAGYCKDMVFQRLTGVRTTDPSDASSPFGDPDGHGYADNALKLCRLDHRADLLAPVSRPVPLAPLDAVGAALITLPEGTPAVAGPFDLAACPVGAGVREPGDGLLVIGTTLGCAVLTEHVDRTAYPAGMHLATAAPNRWVRVLPAMVGCAVLDWTLRMVGMTHDDLEPALTASGPGANGVEMLPYLAPSGERAPFVDPRAHGQLTGLQLGTTREDVVRATCEGIALAARDCFAATELTGRLMVCGGGAQSRPWLQVIADVLQRPLHVAPSPNVGSRGAVLGALAAAGPAVNVEDWTRADDVVRPQQALAGHYDEAFARYRAHQDAARALWRQS
ncbi:MAG: carbohydrate kinase [Actinomycetota bacterium]|nr:carbohydrate kinase [Actinomycetota bacterium]